MTQYVVKSGDNLSTIAQRYGVPVSAVSGYRSGNPNLIYPGEVLSINNAGGQIAGGTSTTGGARSFGELLTNSGYKAPTNNIASNPAILSNYTNVPYSTNNNTAQSNYQQAAVSAQPSGNTIPAFNFDWAAEEKAALEKLAPYYQQKLDEAGGDVNIALQRIEEDYKQGLRYREEDRSVQTTEANRLKPEELNSTVSSLNKRGVLFGEQTGEGSQAPYSQLASSYYLDPLAQRQQARQDAIERAFGRAQETADITKTRGVSDTQREFEKYKRTLEEEKKEKAVLDIAPMRYQQELAKYNALVSQNLG